MIDGKTKLTIGAIATLLLTGIAICLWLPMVLSFAIDAKNLNFIDYFFDYESRGISALALLGSLLLVITVIIGTQKGTASNLVAVAMRMPVLRVIIGAMCCLLCIIVANILFFIGSEGGRIFFLLLIIPMLYYAILWFIFALGIPSVIEKIQKMAGSQAG